MDRNDNLAVRHDTGEILEQAAARMGFTAADMEALLESDLNIDQLLEYLQAVLSDRMN